jgi:transporter family protein
MWFLYAICSGLSAALLAIIINIGLKQEDALLMTSFFSIVMAIMLITTCFLTNRFDNFSFSSLGKRELLSILFAGFLAGLGYLTYFLALKSGPINNVVAIDRLSILYVVALSIIFLNAKVTSFTWIGSLLIVIGTYLVASV